MKFVLTRLITATLLLASSPLMAAPQGDGKEESVKNLIDNLSSDSGEVRVAATKAIFEKGKSGLEALQNAGAKQISPHGTINTRRLDMVYSLIEGFRKNPASGLAGYKSNSFGLHLEAGTTEKDVIVLGRKYGFTPSGNFRPDGRPFCYVKLAKGKALEAVVKSLLMKEPSVISINLNYFEA